MKENNKIEKILITGVAGFIGYHLAKYLLLNTQYLVTGIDNLNDYYDIELKKYRLKELKLINKDRFIFNKTDISNFNAIKKICFDFKPDVIINLAAQAGVRYSIVNPKTYINSNIIGFYNILECCRQLSESGCNVKHLLFASSSSVYGKNTKIPYSTDDIVNKPVSLYAATKGSNELMGYSYSSLYKIPMTGLRFFTVYGPAGRPDMAYFKFVDKLIHKKKIDIYNYGKCKRDFTYIDDIVYAINKLIDKIPKKDKFNVPYIVYNIGNSNPVKLLTFINIIEKELITQGLVKKNFDFAKYKNYLPMQKGDVVVTYSDTKPLEKLIKFKPNTSLEFGIKSFVEWYKKFYL